MTICSVLYSFSYSKHCIRVTELSSFQKFLGKDVIHCNKLLQQEKTQQEQKYSMGEKCKALLKIKPSVKVDKNDYNQLALSPLLSHLSHLFFALTSSPTFHVPKYIKKWHCGMLTNVRAF